MLDTNAVSYLVHKRSERLQSRLEQLSPEDRVSISVVTEAEMRYGVALKPDAQRLAHTVEAVLSAVEILPWTSDAAMAYAALRSKNKLRGLAAGNLDLLIAAHAMAVGAVLVTSDIAISRLVGGLVTVNWADDLRRN
jgi:tRNA(fMet)-specific endonuclease VapC